MSDLTVRRAVDADVPAVLALLRDAMGRADDERFAALFRWKHVDNAFGPSPAWVALDGERVVAVRYLMRWEFELGGARRRAVRAVDTATHPDYQGRGLFKRLTLRAIEELRAEGVDFVFNTPNNQSRPGYLSMGWQVVGKPVVAARPLRARGALAMLRARGVPAEHFSLDSRAGDAAADVLADTATVAGVLEAVEAIDAIDAGRQPATGLRSRLDPEVLRWRYGGDLLRYRAVVEPGGIALFRLRRRGPAVEAAIALVLAGGRPAAARALVRRVLRALRGEADYAVAIGSRPLATFVPLPGAGPTLTWRGVAAAATCPPLAEWRVTLGDIELF